MKKFYAVTISRMRNGAHYNFMHLFLTLLKEQTSENAEFNKRKENIEAVLKEENRNLLIAQGSTFTQPLHEADASRNRLFVNINRVVTGHANLPEITGNEAAMKLSTLLQKYKVSVNWKIGQKTGILTNLVEDLLGETYQTEVETLGIKAAVEKLKAENERVNAMLLARSKEKSEFVRDALAKARIETDKAYADMTEFIEAYCKVFDDKQMEKLIDTWNVEIKRSLSEMLPHSNKGEADNAPQTDATNPPAKDPATDQSTNQPSNKPSEQPTDKPTGQNGEQTDGDSSGIITDVTPEKQVATK